MKRPSLRTLFIVSAIVVILITSGGAAYITHLNASIAMRAVSDAVHRELAARVVEHLRGFLALPHVILEQNARLISSGRVSADDAAALQALFLQQAAVPTAITSLYFGNSRGGLAGAGHEGARETFYTTGTDGFVPGRFVKTAYELTMTAGPVVFSMDGYDARERPWFRTAAARDGGVWGAIYPLFTGDDLSLPASRAVRDSQGRLLGVLGSDIFISRLARFLGALHSKTEGLTYIMDGDGLIVASSTGDPPFQIDPDGTPSARLKAIDSPRPAVAESARLVLTGPLSSTSASAVATAPAAGPAASQSPASTGVVSHIARVSLAGEPAVLGMTPYHDPRGVTWSIVTIVPAALYEQPVTAANMRTLGLIAAAAAAMACLAILIIRRGLAPLTKVTAAATAVGRGDLSQGLPERGGTEIRALARAFNGMVAHLRAARTEQSRQMAALQKSNAELESFAHVAAHDLREPLRTIASYATLLRRRIDDRLSGEESEFLDYIHQGALRMDALISDLLDFSRVGRTDRPRAAVPLAMAIETALEDLGAGIDFSRTDIVVPDDLPTVQGHADDLVRVFTNLIGNAIKYGRPDEPLDIRIEAVRLAGDDTGAPARCRVTVRDNGIGLPTGEGYEERIFGLFKRLHARDAHGGGTGIGLSICRKVVEHHGGRIWAESGGENQGCAIHFTLPLADT